MKVSFVKADGVKLLIPLISPASTQQSIQVMTACTHAVYYFLFKTFLINKLNQYAIFLLIITLKDKLP